MKIKNLPPLQTEGRKFQTDDGSIPSLQIFSASVPPAQYQADNTPTLLKKPPDQPDYSAAQVFAVLKVFSTTIKGILKLSPDL